MAAKDLVGQVFGRLTVVKRDGSNYRGDAMWLCLCSCGATFRAKGYRLRRGKAISCGCRGTGPLRVDHTGQRFGRLVIEEYAGRDSHRGSIYRCRCDCGKATEVRLNALKRGWIRSCGCLKIEHDRSRYGSSNPNYNPRLTDDDRWGARNIPGYDDWARAVKEINDFRCASCGLSPSGRLVSHHLYSYRAYGDSRLDIANGVCMCLDCHREFHKSYGFGGNTPEQFQEFLLRRVS
jgi:hypothetical protein